jgi:hypothetical protein
MFSLGKNVHNCKVSTQHAKRMQSERIFNPSEVINPVWNNQDDFGRFVQPNTRKLYFEGAYSADALVSIENYLIPTHVNSVTLNGYGIQGTDLYN